jgi:hypothetical protein
MMPRQRLYINDANGIPARALRAQRQSIAERDEKGPPTFRNETKGDAAPRAQASLPEGTAHARRVHYMDRLSAQVLSSEQWMLFSLARAEEDLYRVRRRRRRLVSTMALASLLCFAAAPLGTASWRWASLLFGVLAVASLATWYGERRLARRRNALVERLPVQYRLRLGGLE